MPQADPVEHLDRATVSAFAIMAEATPGGRVERQDGLVLVIGSNPSPVIVNTILTEGRGIPPAAVDGAVERYRAIGHVPSLMTRDHADEPLTRRLQANGWRPLLRLPGMVLERRLPAEAAPTGATVHEVIAEEDRERWIEGNLRGFAEDEEEQGALRSAFQTLASLRSDRMTAWWIEADGRGVASALTALDPGTGTGVVGWVGTDRDYRRRGLGRAVTIATVNAAFDRGAIAVGLQASPMGLPVYERLGFRTICSYGLWLPPAP